MGKESGLNAGRHSRLGISPSFVIVMTTFIDMVGFGMIIPLLPFHPETVDAGALALGILIGSFALMQFIFSPILGRVSDKVGRRPVILLSVFSSAVSFIVFAVADSFIMLLLSRIAAGMATEEGVAQAYIADITDEGDRTSGLGKVGAAHGAGFIVGPAIGGFLSIYGFSAAGFVAAGLTVVNFLFVLFFLPESNAPNGVRKEFAGSESYLGRLVTVLKKPLIGTVFVIIFITAFAFSAIPVLLPLLGKSFFGFEEVQMSYVFMYIGVVQIVLQGFLIGRLSKKLGDKKMIVISSFFMTVGVFCMSLFVNVVTFLLSITLFSSGVGILGTVLPSFISKRTPADEQGGILGIAQSVGSVARIPGPLIAGFIADLAGLNTSFLFSTFVVFIAFCLGFKVFQGNNFRHQPEKAVVQTTK